MLSLASMRLPPAWQAVSAFSQKSRGTFCLPVSTFAMVLRL
jgi:hypothetical protein